MKHRESMPEIKKVDRRKDTPGAWLAGAKIKDSDIKIVNFPIVELKKAQYNPRTISEAQMTALQASIQKFGLEQPIIVNAKTKTIIGGHQRLEAYKITNRTTIPAILIDGLTPETEKAMNLALNKISGEWQVKELGEILKEFTEMKTDNKSNIIDVTGFEAKEIDDILKQLTDKQPQAQSEIAPTPEFKMPAEGKDFPKIYKFGKHLLLHGDSTNPEHYKMLMQGEKAAMVWTDPPYGIAYKTQDSSRSAEIGKEILNDNLDKQSFQKFLDAFMQATVNSAKEDAAYYICFGYQRIEQMKKALAGQKMSVHSYIIWQKNKQTFGLNAHYMHKYEVIIYASRAKNLPYFEPILQVYKQDIKNLSKKKATKSADTPDYNSDVWKVDKVEDMIHVNEKPVELVSIAIQHSSRKGEIVLDPFAGSCSCLEACERTGRVFRGIELDEAYVKRAIRRYNEMKK